MFSCLFFLGPGGRGGGGVALGGDGVIITNIIPLVGLFLGHQITLDVSLVVQ